MKYKTLFTHLILLISVTVSYTQSAHDYRKNGDEEYLRNEFQSAEEQYRKSLQEEKTLKGTYNLGNSVYNQARFEEASDYFNNALTYAEDDLTKSTIYYNLGNSLLQEQKLEESIEAYKSSLKLNPSDVDAKQNLFLAMNMKKKMEQQQQQEQQQEQNQEKKEENEQNQNENKEEGDQQQQQEESSQSQQQDQQQQQQDQQQQDGEKQGLNKEDAAKLLQVIENEEKKVQEKLRKMSATKKKIEKDW